MAQSDRMECGTLITLRKFESKLAILRKCDVKNRHTKLFDKLEFCAYSRGYSLAALYETLIRVSNSPNFDSDYQQYLADKHDPYKGLTEEQKFCKWYCAYKQSGMELIDLVS